MSHVNSRNKVASGAAIFRDKLSAAITAINIMAIDVAIFVLFLKARIVPGIAELGAIAIKP